MSVVVMHRCVNMYTAMSKRLSNRTDQHLLSLRIPMMAHTIYILKPKGPLRSENSNPWNCSNMQTYSSNLSDLWSNLKYLGRYYHEKSPSDLWGCSTAVEVFVRFRVCPLFYIDDVIEREFDSFYICRHVNCWILSMTLLSFDYHSWISGSILSISIQRSYLDV